ncbi:hypothetical protein FKM82_016217 [Ascaphus truei]
MNFCMYMTVRHMSSHGVRDEVKTLRLRKEPAGAFGQRVGLLLLQLVQPHLVGQTFLFFNASHYFLEEPKLNHFRALTNPIFYWRTP